MYNSEYLHYSFALQEFKECFPKFNGPIETNYLRAACKERIQDMERPEKVKKILAEVIDEHILRYSIELIGYSRIQVIPKLITFNQPVEMLLQHFTEKSLQKILCEVVDKNKLKPLKLIPSEEELPSNMILETDLSHIQVKLGDIIKISIYYDFSKERYCVGFTFIK